MANTVASTLITRCLDNMSRSSTGTTRSGVTMETQALNWLNRVLYQMSRKHDFREMYKQYSTSTVASTKTYALPINWKKILDLRLIDGTSSVKLELVIPSMFDRSIPYPENSTTGRPLWYVPYGNNFDVYRIPDKAYVMYLKCVLWPTIITDVATLIDYEPNKDDVIVAGMCAEGFNTIQMYEDATLWRKEYNTTLNDAIDIELQQPDWSPVGQGFDSGYARSGIGDYWNMPFIRSSYL